MRRLRVLFPAWALLFPSAAAICEGECNRITNLLTSCSLPGLTIDADTVRDNAQTRNISGLPATSSWDSGPATFLVTSLSEAACLCTDARLVFRSCIQCWIQAEADSGVSRLNERRIIDYYREDCNEFGYYANASLAYPSTTRTNLPLPLPTGGGPGTIDESNSCTGVCGVVRAQIAACDLVPLEVAAEPPLTHVPSPDGAYYARVLLNRTAGECVCTLPFLRRTMGCRWCLLQEDGMETANQMVHLYNFDCNQMGYWSDAAMVVPEEGPGATSSVTTQGPAPTPTTGPFPDGVGRVELGAQPGALLACAGLVVGAMLLV